MKREFNVEANIGKPQVAYRETIKRVVDKYDFTHKKQTGGSGQFAKVQITFGPLTDAEDGVFLRVREQGHRRPHPARVHPERGRGHPGCPRGRHHRRLPGREREGLPARRCIPRRRTPRRWPSRSPAPWQPRRPLRKAQPVILEPLMDVEVRTPEEYMGDVIGDLNSRRGQVQSMEDASGVKIVRALVPLSEMFGYVGDLRSKTQGRAMYTMQFDSYAEVPGSIAEEIVAKTRGRVRSRGKQVGSFSCSPRIPVGHPPRRGRLRSRSRSTTIRSPRRTPSWRRPSSSGPSRTSTSAPSVTSTTARPR